MRCAAFNPNGLNGWNPCTRKPQGHHHLCRRHEDALYGAILGLRANMTRELMQREDQADEQLLRLLGKAIYLDHLHGQPVNRLTGLPLPPPPKPAQP
jgi:hypothetical protein